MLKFYSVLSIILFSCGICSPQTNIPIKTNEDSIVTELEQALNDEVDPWYPVALDSTYGGYLSDLNYRWEPDGSQDKMIVTQARHIWSASNASEYYRSEELLKIAEHGFRFLKDKMLDKEYGGFYDLVEREGAPQKENGNIIKRAYGNAFAIYGLAEFYKVSGSVEALELAKQTFLWLEKNSFDPEYGGYFQFMHRNGTSFKEGFEGYPPKDQNSSIHILEAFTALYEVWKDSLLKQRLMLLLHLIRDEITTEKGYMILFFTEDWTPISFRDADQATRERNYYFDHISYGHDVETAYLMLEASKVLQAGDYSITLAKAKKMVDHALLNGWDNEYGGLFDGGYYFANDSTASVVKATKEWWAQAEALNSFLMMSKIFPEDSIYFERFLQTWDYIKKYLLDPENKGWYWSGIDKEPEKKYAPKGSIWKANYHTSRALINCIKMLKNN